MELLKILESIKGIRKPIPLAALSIVILYLVFKAVLSLEIFNAIDENQTYLLINNIISYVFYLAILTLVFVFTDRIIKHSVKNPNLSIKNNIKQVKEEKKTIEEIVFINDQIQNEVSSCQNISLTFGETRRILSVIVQLKDLSEQYYHDITDKFSEDILLKILDWYTEVKKFISEASIVFPFPKDHKYTMTTEYLKEYKYNVLTKWDSIKKLLTNNGLLDLKKLKEIENSETRKWELQGYKNQKEYSEFISPTIDTLIKTKDMSEIELVRYISSSKDFTEKELLDNGFDRGTIVEIINILMRSNLVTTNFEDGLFHLSSVGQEILKKEFNL